MAPRVSDAHPKSNQYTSDIGLFVTMLPYLEGQSLYSRFVDGAPSNSIVNRSVLGLAPSILKCPSASQSEVLHSMSGIFSGPSIAGIDGTTCDYMGNDGYITVEKLFLGTIRLKVGSYSRELRLSEVTEWSSYELFQCSRTTIFGTSWSADLL